MVLSACYSVLFVYVSAGLLLNARTLFTLVGFVVLPGAKLRDANVYFQCVSCILEVLGACYVMRVRSFRGLWFVNWG